MSYKKLIPFINGENELAANVVTMAEDYCFAGADELFLYNYSKITEEREEFLATLKEIDKKIDIPFIVGMYAARFEDVKKALMAKYKDPIHKELEETAKKVGGHGGMDYIMDYRLVYCLRNGLPLDMDVYDLAEWCCMAELTRLSIENGSAPVEVPDFTRGGWNKVQGYRHAFAE